MEENCYTKDILYCSHANMHSKLQCDTRKIIPWIYRLKLKIHFAIICFVHKMNKFSLFGLTFGRKRSCDSVTGGPIFANLVSKYPQFFKEKSHEAARLKARRFCVRGKICLGGPPRPPPPPVQNDVMSKYRHGKPYVGLHFFFYFS